MHEGLQGSLSASKVKRLERKGLYSCDSAALFLPTRVGKVRLHHHIRLQGQLVETLREREH
eukprot:1159871-Pelagomonas_calceolata.AAC.1